MKDDDAWKWYKRNHNSRWISLQFTPGAIVIEEGAEVPEEYWKVKTTRDIDKIALKNIHRRKKILMSVSIFRKIVNSIIKTEVVCRI